MKITTTKLKQVIREELRKSLRGKEARLRTESFAALDDGRAQAGEEDLQNVVTNLESFAQGIEGLGQQLTPTKVAEFIEDQVILLKQVAKALRATHEKSGERYAQQGGVPAEDWV